MECCMKCGRILTADEIGLYKKLVNRGAQSFLCLACLGAHFHVEEARLREKIDQFRKSGCSLFV